jgi:hypothetical protein
LVEGETVEVLARPWWIIPGSYRAEEVVWKEAKDLKAQKEAIDRIVGNPLNHRSHRSLSGEVQEFATREYARLKDIPKPTLPAMVEMGKTINESNPQAPLRLPHSP